MDYDTLEADRRFSIRLADELARERAKELGIKLPESGSASLVDAAYGMMLIDITCTNEEGFCSWLCSPLGYIEVPWEEGYTTVWQAAKALGIKIPHRKNKRTWENIEPYWVAVALSKL